jgi:hypothetical protein
LDDGLIFPSELTLYEQYLEHEWRTQFEIMKENLGELPTDEELKRFGKLLFDNLVETKALRPIRQRYFDTGFSKGTFHMLSNAQKVGWHADFKKRLAELMVEGAKQAS